MTSERAEAPADDGGQGSLTGVETTGEAGRQQHYYESANYGMGFAPQHVRLFIASAISPEVVQARGYRTVTEKTTLARAGFTPSQQITPGLQIPWLDIDGNVTHYEYRADEPRLNKQGKTVKYDRPTGSSNRLDIHPFVREKVANPDVPLWITEGIRKVDSAITAGLCCVGLAGVNGWKGKNEHKASVPLPDFHHVALNSRRAVLAFDGDSATNRNVHAALVSFSDWLKSKGADVYYCQLPIADDTGKKIGLDDYLAAHTVSELEALVTRHLPDYQPSLDELTQTVDGLKPFTDAGNGQRLAEKYGENIRYDWTSKTWLVWDGARWQPDPGGKIHELAKRSAYGIYSEIERCAKASDKEAVAAHAKNSQSAPRLNAAIELARSEPGIPVRTEQLDTHLDLIVAPNGTVDLQTGELLPADRAHLITRAVACGYNPAGECPNWMAFLNKIMHGNAELIAFLQRAVGYSITGHAGERVLFVLWGSGANGKSTFVETLRFVFADYALRTPIQTLLQDRKGGENRGLARLHGARFVTSNEAEEYDQFAVAQVKDLTGDDTVAARKLYAEQFEFKPQCTIWIATNHKPKAAADDQALWDRMRLIPFTFRIPDHERDVNFRARQLEPEAEGILAWAVQGAVAWYKEGLGIPPEVQSATDAYREENDSLGDFLADCCIAEANTFTSGGALYDAYRTWTITNGLRAVGSRTFGDRLERRGYERERRHTGRGFLGIRLRRDGDSRDVVTLQPPNCRNFSQKPRHEKSFGKSDPETSQRHADTAAFDAQLGLPT